MLDLSNFVRLFHRQSFVLYGTTVQGGMEVPCTLHFRCNSKKVQQLASELLQQMPEDILLVPSLQNSKNDCISTPISSEETPSSEPASDAIWVTYNRNTLKQSDRKIIEDGSQLTDKHIGLAQTLIRGQFPKLGGLHSTLLQDRYHNLSSNSVQIVHCSKRHHWIVASSILSASGHVHIYDSPHTTIDEESIELVTNMFGCEDSFVRVPKVQIQTGGTDCGLFAIANMTSLAYGIDPLVMSYEQRKMRAHLMECLGKGKLIPFPTSD